MPRIERRGDRWTARISLTDPDTGTRTQRRITARTKREVEDQILEIQADHRRGTYVEPDATLLGDYLDDWLTRWRGSDATRYMRTWAIARIKAAPLGQMPVGRVRLKHVQQFVDGLVAGGDVRSTIENTLIPLNMAMRRAVRLGLVAAHPVQGVELPPAAPRRWTILDEAQAHQLIEATHDDRYHGLWVLAVTLGLRRGELLGLRWGDLDLERGVLRVARSVTRDAKGRPVVGTATKTTAGTREIILPQLCREALRRQRVMQLERRMAAGEAWTDSGAVFDSGLGKHIVSPTRLRARWVQLRAELDLPEMRIHDLRHTAATHMIRAGIPIPVVAKILGHANPAITMRVYAHVVAAMEQDAADRIDALYGWQPEARVTNS
jgi:integrase